MDDAEIADGDEEVEFLKKKTLQCQFKYNKNPLGSMRRRDNGDLIRRSFVGTESDYKTTEASKFLQKLNCLQKLKTSIQKNVQKRTSSEDTDPRKVLKSTRQASMKEQPYTTSFTFAASR